MAFFVANVKERQIVRERDRFVVVIRSLSTVSESSMPICDEELGSAKSELTDAHIQYKIPPEGFCSLPEITNADGGEVLIAIYLAISVFHFCVVLQCQVLLQFLCL